MSKHIQAEPATSAAPVVSARAASVDVSSTDASARGVSTDASSGVAAPRSTSVYDPEYIPRSGDGQERRRTLILVNVLIMTLMVCIDMSIVGVALPVMARELGVGMGDVQWVNTAYLLVSCAAILVGGRLGDIYGKVRIFMIGVALFTVGSLLCGVVPSLALCIVGRTIQGLGAACAFSNNQGIITETFPDNERGHALGWIATAASLGSLIGPTLGGLILTLTSWGGIFLVNVPVGIIMFVMGLKNLPNRKPAHPGKLDVRGSVLLFVSLMLVVSGVTELQQSSTPVVWAQLGVGVVLLMAFVLVERRVADPVFPLAVLRNKTLLLNMFTMFALFFVIGGQSMVLPFYFQDARGMAPGEAALYMTVIPVIIGVVGPVAGAMSDRIGCYIPTCLGLFLACAGEVGVSLWGTDSPTAQLVITLVVYGLGSGLFNAPNNSLVMGSARREDLGVVGGFAAFARTFGQAAGLTVATSVLYGTMSVRVGYPVTDYVDGRPDVFLGAMSAVFLTLAAVVALGFVCTVVRFVRVRRLERVEARLENAR